jgi:hypothetical protein
MENNLDDILKDLNKNTNENKIIDDPIDDEFKLKKIWADKDQFFKESTVYIWSFSKKLLGFLGIILGIIASAMTILAPLAPALLLPVVIIILIIGALIFMGWALGSVIAGMKAVIKFMDFIPHDGVLKWISRILLSMVLSWKFVFMK